MSRTIIAMGVLCLAAAAAPLADAQPAYVVTDLGWAQSSRTTSGSRRRERQRHSASVSGRQLRHRRRLVHRAAGAERSKSGSGARRGSWWSIAELNAFPLIVLSLNGPLGLERLRNAVVRSVRL